MLTDFSTHNVLISMAIAETRMLEDMILHEVDMLELKDNTCSTESTSSKALDSETAKTDYSKKCINPYSSERFGDLSLFRPR